MRTRLLVLLSLVMLLLQPMTLLHGLAHADAHAHGHTTTAALHGASTADPASAVEAACSLCLGLGALGLGLWPAALTLPAPAATVAPPRAEQPLGQGGTAAGYHARGPPPSLH